jgi:hypothetical protein
MPTNLDRALGDDVLRIIGVEFNIQDPNGRIHEMQMFVPNGHGLVIPRRASAEHGYGQPQYRPLVTFHSTIGDYTIGAYDNICPW